MPVQAQHPVPTRLLPPVPEAQPHLRRGAEGVCHQGPVRLLHQQHSLHTRNAGPHRARLPLLVPKRVSQGPGETDTHTHVHVHSRARGGERWPVLPLHPCLIPALPTLGAQAGSRAGLWGSASPRLRACRGLWGRVRGQRLRPAASRLLFSMCTDSSTVICWVDEGKLPTPGHSFWTHLGPPALPCPFLPTLHPCGRLGPLPAGGASGLQLP